MSKTYSGGVDFYVGFNKDKMDLKQLQYLNLHNETTQKLYSCSGANKFFNYTLSPNHFWCYSNITTYNNQTLQNENKLTLIKNHSFTGGSLVTATALWNETNEELWSDLNLNFQKINYSYQDTNKWIYAEGININQNILYKTRIYFDAINPFSNEVLKYTFCFKPSSWTIQQMLDNNYCIDPTWTSGLNDNVEGLYKFDENTGTKTFESRYNQRNFTLVGAGTTWTTNKINGTSSIDFSGVAGNYLSLQGNYPEWFNLTNSMPFTIAVWLGVDDFTNEQHFFSKTTNGNDGFEILIFAQEIYIEFGTTTIRTADTDPVLGGYQFYCLNYNGNKDSGGVSLWINGTNQTMTGVGVAIPDITVKANLTLGGGANFNSYWYNGRMDEPYIWNTTKDCSTLWNSASGMFFEDTIFPDLNITFPFQNNTNNSNNLLDINYTVSDIHLNSTWYANDTYSVANKSLGTNGNLFNITNLTWSEGKHNVTIYVNDSSGNLNFSTISFTIDTTLPTISIVFPSVNNSNGTNTLNVNFTASDLNLFNFWYNNDTYSVANKSLGVLGTQFNITNITWSEGKHNVTVWANDSAGNYIFATISFTIDTTPPNLTIVAPSGIVTSLTPQILINASDIVGLGTCWYNVTTLTDTSSEIISFRQISNCTDDVIPSGQLANSVNYVMFGFVNDSAGNTNVTNSTFTTPASPSGGAPSGGGGGGNVVILVAEGNWTIGTDVGGGKYELQMIEGSSRTKSLIFENLGEKDREMELFCENVKQNEKGNLTLTDEGICKYVSFSDPKFTLPVQKQVKTFVEFTIALPEDVERKTYIFNVVAVDEEGHKGTLTTQVGFSFFAKLYSKINVPFFDFEIYGWLLWILIFFPLITLFTYLTINVPFFDKKFSGNNFAGGFVFGLILLLLI